jgi:hypothetical protein
MTAGVLWLNLPFIVFAFALWVGVPLWMVLRHPDRDPRETHTIPAYLRQRGAMPPAIAAQRTAPEQDHAERRELVSAAR